MNEKRREGETKASFTHRTFLKKKVGGNIAFPCTMNTKDILTLAPKR